jgi:hypothetical protein
LTALANTSLLTCQSNRFIDNSANNYTLSKAGDTTIQKFSPFLPTANASPTVSGGSAYFDGTGDYLTITSPTLWTIPTGTTPLTVEVWVYPTATFSGTIKEICQFFYLLNSNLKGKPGDIFHLHMSSAC